MQKEQVESQQYMNEIYSFAYLWSNFDTNAYKLWSMSQWERKYIKNYTKSFWVSLFDFTAFVEFHMETCGFQAVINHRAFKKY
jgi:hypothetical protein